MEEWIHALQNYVSNANYYQSNKAVSFYFFNSKIQYYVQLSKYLLLHDQF